VTGEAPHLDDEARSFLLLEFETMREMRTALNSLVATEINIYVAIVGATFVALAPVRDILPVGDDIVRTLSVGALCVVVLLGLATYFRVVESRITVVKYARSMNRVRSYFARSTELLHQYISPDIYDDQPPFGAIGSTRPYWGSLLANTGLIAILNSSAFAAIAGLIVPTVGGVDRSWIAGATGSVFLGSVIVHAIYQNARYKSEEARWVSFHPSSAGR
jgi:hypothetical protein